jgi:hypothetical protein
MIKKGEKTMFKVWIKRIANPISSTMWELYYWMRFMKDQ